MHFHYLRLERYMQLLLKTQTDNEPAPGILSGLAMDIKSMLGGLRKQRRVWKHEAAKLGPDCTWPPAADRQPERLMQMLNSIEDLQPAADVDVDNMDAEAPCAWLCRF